VKNFVIIGAAGYIAPRHLKAIKETGNNLLAAFDIHDSVGVLDAYFPEAHFFTEFERLDRHLEKIKRTGTSIDFIVVCSPNYLHDAHIRFGLRLGADVICEKPMVLNPWNVDALMQMEQETGRKIYNILQLRHHPALMALKQQVDAGSDHTCQINLQYITARGNWYHYSWKGQEDKSGGLVSNIGIHFFDALYWVFGKCKQLRLDQLDEKTAYGFLELEKATINWQLSIDEALLPPAIQQAGGRTFRSLVIDGTAIDFSNGFEDLHTKSYEAILKGERTSLAEVRDVIELIYKVRNSKDNFKQL
jgi:UDP-N-acetyl-2-amino-2-deoxyglucuronate dehydrogenase